MKNLTIELRGEILSSNFDEFKGDLITKIQSLNYELKTDDDFTAADINTKALREIEKNLLAEKEKALEQASEVRDLFDSIDEVSAEVRDARLALERQIKTRKAKLKEEILTEAFDRIPADYRSHFSIRVADSVKGKRTFETIKKAADTEALLINEEINKALTVIGAAVVNHGEAIAHDRKHLVTLPPEALTIELERRVERKEAAERAAVERAAAEVRRKAEAEERRKQEAAHETTPDLPARPEPVPEPSKAPEVTSDTVSAPEPAESAESGSGSDFAEMEFNAYLGVAKKAFGMIKPVKERLQFAENIERVEEFSQAVNAAWSKLLKGGSQ